MRKVLAAIMAALMVTSAIAPAMARSRARPAHRAVAQRCAKPEDVTAMQAAAVQQQLMVAALSCNAVPQYNNFVTGYQPELFAADRQLLKFFRRMNTRHGEGDYHAFKTRMANMSSQLSLHDLAKFCSNASAAFTLALGPTKSTLAAFVATQPITETSDIATCEFQIAGGMNPRAPRKVPVPIANPQRQATGLGPALGNAVAGTVTGVATVVGGIFSHLPGFGTPASTH